MKSSFLEGSVKRLLVHFSMEIARALWNSLLRILSVPAGMLSLKFAKNSIWDC